MAKAKKSGTTTEKKSVVKKEEAGLPVSLEEMEAMSGEGFENADKDAYAIPFLRILQKGSPQCDEEDPAFIDGAKPGMFFNTITGQIYGKELVIIPVHYQRDFVEWEPNRGGFQGTHGSDPIILERVQEVDDKNNQILENGNIIQDTRNHYVLLADYLTQGPIILSLSSTGIKHSRKWMTLMSNLMIPNSDKQAPMFAGVWTVETVRNENDQGVWYQVGDKSMTSLKFDRFVNKEQLDAGQALRKLLSSGNVEAAWDSNTDDVVPGADNSGPAKPIPEGATPLDGGGYKMGNKMFDANGDEIPF